jgi:fructoselysine-6-P-deglycase FrlB-like protein
MTHFLKDILRQPEELQRTIEILTGRNEAGPGALDAASAAIRAARHVYLTGIGSSWHAALNVSGLFHRRAHPVYFSDAAELLTFATFPKDSAMILISRSGMSAEIVQLVAKARRAGVKVIGITNAPEGTLAKEAHIAIVVPVAFDHAISVNTYTTLALAAGMLAHRVIEEGSGSLEELTSGEAGTREPPLILSKAQNKEKRQQAATLQAARGGLTSAPEAREAPGERKGGSGRDSELAESLSRTIAEAARAIPGWQEQVAASIWLTPHRTTYFLARGPSLGSAYESRLLWEEGVKAPATAMGTGAFRHGPQEIVGEGVRFGVWIDGTLMREPDLAVARDLRKLGARVMLIGQKLPGDAGDVVFQLPAIAADWQFLIDIIPAQLAAERLARLSGADCDSFRLSSYIVEDQGGLLPKKAGKKQQEKSPGR